MSRPLLRPSVLAAAIIVAGCSKPAAEPSGAAKPAAGPVAPSSTEPGSSVVFEVNPDQPYVKLDAPSVQLSGTPVVSFYKDGAVYDYTVRLHDGPAGAKLTCADYMAEMDKSPIVLFVSGKSPAKPKAGDTLTETRAEISVTKPGDKPVASGGMRGLVVTFTKGGDTALSGTISLPAVSAAAKNVAGSFNNAIVCEET